METNVTILGLAYESPKSKIIWVLTDWQLDAGKVAVAKRRTEDLSNNLFEINFEVTDGTDQNLKLLTRADLLIPVGELNDNHKFRVNVFEGGKFLMTTEMDTGNAHHN